jgi:hypothetical protein
MLDNERKALAVPIVDKIDWSTLEHREVYARGKRYTGIFEWGFLYKEQVIPPNDPHVADLRQSEPYWYVSSFFILFYLFCFVLLRCYSLLSAFSLVFMIL